jgi:hypothetical protein
MTLIVKVRNLFLSPFLKIRSQSGSITPIIRWPHYGDHRVASLRRSSGGSFTAITEWLYSTDHQHQIYNLYNLTEIELITALKEVITVRGFAIRSTSVLFTPTVALGQREAQGLSFLYS